MSRTRRDKFCKELMVQRGFRINFHKYSRTSHFRSLVTYEVKACDEMGSLATNRQKARANTNKRSATLGWDPIGAHDEHEWGRYAIKSLIKKALKTVSDSEVPTTFEEFIDLLYMNGFDNWSLVVFTNPYTEVRYYVLCELKEDSFTDITFGVVGESKSIFSKYIGSRGGFSTLRLALKENLFEQVLSCLLSP